MAQNSLDFHSTPVVSDAGFGRMVIASLVAHALIVALFSGLFVSSARKDDRPVYYVDLVNLPVERPQAGRPDGGKTKTAKKTEPKPKAAKKVKVAPKKSAETVKLAAKKTPAVKPKAPVVKKTKPKAAPKKKSPPKTKPKSVEKDYQSVLSAVEALRAKKEKSGNKGRIEDLKNKLAALTAQDTRSAGSASEAPLGVADGRGDQAGPSFGLWLQSYLTSNWSLSKYQLSRQDLEAEIHVVYDREGNLIRKKLIRSSGDPVFDRSVEDAVLKSKKLPTAPKRRMEFDIIFNLKDLLEKS
jgi:TonB family protein